MVQNSSVKSLYPVKIMLSVFITALVVLAGKAIYTQFDSMAVSFSSIDTDVELASIEPEFFRQKAMEKSTATDTGLALYRAEESRADVIWFYSHITNNEAVTKVILENADKNNIPLSLAFALSWEESRYQVRAVNKNASSVDRGLFQLNSKAFPKLTEKEFFNPELNAHYGLTHLSYCLDLSGNEVAALAMYNAGTTKVRNNNTPQRTLDYVSRIQSYRNGLERLFLQQVSIRYEIDKFDRVTALSKR